MAQGLSVSDVVNVSVMLSPTAAVGRNFGSLLILGSSPVIDVVERMRTYTTLTGVGQDFGTTAPEYLAASAFFAQSPMPYRLLIGRWAQAPTSGVLHGAPVPIIQQAAVLASIQAAVAPTFTITIDGTAKVLTGLVFTSALNFNGVAAVLSAALSPAATCRWNGSRFDILSSSAGAASSVGYAVSPTGADLATIMGLTMLAGASLPVVGSVAETAVAAVQAASGLSGDFYALAWAPLVPLTDVVALQIAATIEATSPVRVCGFTTAAAGAIDPTSTTDLGSLLSASLYSRTLVQYSTTNPYAVCSFFGRALSVNFTGNNTVLTMKFKQEPGVIPELLSETSAATLTAKHINVFVAYQNATAIVQQGTMAGGRFFDEVQGIDWLSNQVQTDLFNVLLQAPKIPQTDAGVHVLLTQVEATLSQAVVNGLVAPGVWNAEGFGQLKRTDPLPKGFYVYAALVASQPQSDREARIAPLLQAAIKMAGAIHFASVLISVNR